MVTASAGALNLPSSPHSVISLEFHPRLTESRLNNLFGRYHKPTPGAVGSARVKAAAAGMTSRAERLLPPTPRSTWRWRWATRNAGEGPGACASLPRPQGQGHDECVQRPSLPCHPVSAGPALSAAPPEPAHREPAWSGVLFPAPSFPLQCQLSACSLGVQQGTRQGPVLMGL